MSEVEELIYQTIDEETGYTVPELAERTGATQGEVQRALERMVERGHITSTPDWEYRRSRRVDHE